MQLPDILTRSGAEFINGDEGSAPYRPLLWRCWDITKPWLHVCGLNPSTAGHERNDPTIRREIAFAKSFGCGGLLKTNAFDFRSTNPRVMLEQLEPSSELNDSYIRACVERAGINLAAWGVHGGHNGRERELKFAYRWKCLGLTKDGHPKHPLYVRADTQLIDFNS